ncbi:2-hydroxycarboxylate transporter family protein [Salipaludibacillus sp. CF4.18]|uniref:2-hydroxycarboxylate transporter family protein n=1 Tax=Salipaludibacillus sp. CF4.18 TaxID=3373081 RepID=UPI003F4BB8A0
MAKIFNLIPKSIVDGASQWYQFVAKTFTLALLFGIGVAYTDLNAVLAALSIQYVLIVGAVVLGAAIGAGIMGKFVGFYPIESAITAGLCMANMGGTGDVAVLSASKINGINALCSNCFKVRRSFDPFIGRIAHSFIFISLSRGSH